MEKMHQKYISNQPKYHRKIYAEKIHAQSSKSIYKNSTKNL